MINWFGKNEYITVQEKKKNRKTTVGNIKESQKIKDSNSMDDYYIILSIYIRVFLMFSVMSFQLSGYGFTHQSIHVYSNILSICLFFYCEFLYRL